jgi:uncharacterized protein YodC (DUF2158 family)
MQWPPGGHCSGGPKWSVSEISVVYRWVQTSAALPAILGVLDMLIANLLKFVRKPIRSATANSTFLETGSVSFETGDVVLSPGVQALIHEYGFEEWHRCLSLHKSGNWGEVDDVTAKDNDAALAHGGSVTSRWYIRVGLCSYGYGIEIVTNGVPRNQTVIQRIS